MVFLSSRENPKLMGPAQLGMAVFGPKPGTDARKEKERLLWWVNFWFYLGLVLTTAGIVLQTIGSILALE
jgi:hypothetical protein